MSERRGWNWRRWLLVTAVLVIINVPYLVHFWQAHRAETQGEQVTATVVGITHSGGDVVVAFRFPKSVDSQQELRTVKVDEPVGTEAGRTRELEVSVLPGNPGVFHVDGQVRGWGGLIITLVADLLVVIMLLLAWRLGGRIRRPPLEAVAVADVETGDEGSLLDKQDDGTYVINGEVAETLEHSLVVRLRDRDVTIHLRDHHNPLSVGDRAQVRALLVG